MKFYLSAFLFLFLNLQFSYAEDVQVFLYGKTIDAVSKKTCSATLDIFGPSEERSKVKSNTLTGVYEQVLTAGKKYKIKFSNFDIYPSETEILIPDSSAYFEFNKDFYITHLEEGKEINKINIFEKGSNKISKEGANYLKKLNEDFRINRSMKLILKVNSSDGNSQNTKNLNNAKKSKKQSKSEKKSAKSDSKSTVSLIDSRITALNIEIKNSQYLIDRLTVEPDNNFKTPTTNKKNETSKNTRVIVGEVKDVFK